MSVDIYEGMDDVEIIARSLCVDDAKDPDMLVKAISGGHVPAWRNYRWKALSILESLASAGRYSSPILKDDL